jgi:PAS domain S-box-containing protein
MSPVEAYTIARAPAQQIAGSCPKHARVGIDHLGCDGTNNVEVWSFGQLMDHMDDQLNRSHDAADALGESNERFRLLVEGVRDYAIFMLDPTGHIVSWNSGARLIKGYTKDEVIGQHFSLFFMPEDRQAGKPARLLEIAKREGKYQEEGWRLRKDGSCFWANVLITPLYDAHGKLQGFGKVTRDMTERQQAQETLRQSEERFRLLVEGVRDYAIFMLDASGHIVSWNSGAQLIKGYTKDEIIGRHFSIFYPLEDVRKGKLERELRIATTEGRYEEEGWRIRKGGSRFWANVLITAVFDAHGELRGFAKVTRDLTERKRAEEQREQLHERELQLVREREVRAQMEAAVRMRDTFLTILSHELRTPLTTLLGNAQLLLRRAQREGTLADRERRSVQVIVDQAARLSEMVSLQFDISRLHTGQLHIERAPLNMAALAQQVVEEVLPTITKHSVTYIGPDTPLLVEGDRLRLIQVLHNLVQNAIKYSPAGGEVQVQIERHTGTVSVAVSDEGIGIPQAELPQLFQRFYRASNVDERQISGLGVGLYIVKELVTLHGGTVEVVSEEGQGSTFIITLPLLEEQMAVPAPSMSTTGNVASESIKTPPAELPAKTERQSS